MHRDIDLSGFYSILFSYFALLCMFIGTVLIAFPSGAHNVWALAHTHTKKTIKKQRPE